MKPKIAWWVDSGEYACHATLNLAPDHAHGGEPPECVILTCQKSRGHLGHHEHAEANGAGGVEFTATWKV